MSFAATITHTDIFGGKRVSYGKFTQASGDAGGAITTGFSGVDTFQATGALTAVDASGVVTITTANPGADQIGYWFAVAKS